MAKIKTVEVGQGLIPEGHYVFKVDDVDDSKYEDFGKITINLITKDGKKFSERFTLLKADGKLNEGAQKAWSFWVGIILNQWGAGESDTDDLIGKYLEADVVHKESDQINEKTGKAYVNANLENIKSADGFDGAEDEKPMVDSDEDDDLDDLDDL
ncbi:hypothetical protein MOO45_02765 [Bombilactobacillus folatiphilus]|uniref:DUF669 domain-containing protein n=1 Tax=Bombilactobacillus folatiphilus TaxID=2923362 RepID=A0ABY4PBE2_9LACO|nr:hypothetical protein [Bombilactobacillus folatiphilus]UQS82587.1 hypothetical protein MOO45_02765 [Bombilactobacillus folatiphilus]